MIKTIRADGTVEVRDDADRSLPTPDAAAALSSGETAGPMTVDVDGSDVRLLAARADNGDLLLIGRSLTDTLSNLQRVGLLMVVVAAGGTAVAAVLGFVVARTGLAPLDRLSAAAAEVSRTQDLRATIPADGTDEISRLAGSLNSMLAALDQARTAQRRLVDDAAHELRTPLTSLRTDVELLLRTEENADRPFDPADRQRLLRNLRAQIGELGHLVDEIVQLAREGLPQDRQSPHSLADVVRSAIERARARHPGTRFDAGLDEITVRCNRSAVERAVVNLLDNAAAWTPPEAPVSVSVASRDGQWAVVTVADRGPGVPEAQRQRVFDRFYRIPGAGTSNGSGLGLSIVADVAAQHAGDVRVGADPAGGAVFELRLPLAADAP